MTKASPWRRYGSIRISRDGRVHYSARAHPFLSYVSFLTDGALIKVDGGGRIVLYVDVRRGRVVSACFPADLTPKELRRAVDDLRQFRRGIERWIVPGLELAGTASAFREDNPATYAALQELLKSCRDLPVAPYWQRVREHWLRGSSRAASLSRKRRSR